MSTRQYLRKARVLLGNSDGMISITDLRITFEVNIVQMSKPDRCVINIYNPSMSMLLKALETYTNIQLEVGYGNELTVIYTGEIVYYRTYRENIVDRVLSIFSANSNKLWKTNFIAKTMEEGMGPQETFEAYNENVSALGSARAPLGGALIRPGIAYPRGKILFGRTFDLARKLAIDQNLVIKLIDNQLVLSERIIPNQKEIIDINYDSGLLQQPEVSTLGINVTCLLNPNIGPGRVIHLNTEDIISNQPDEGIYTATGTLGLISLGSGTYYVLDVKHTGDTWGDNWTTSFIASVIESAGATQEDWGDY